MAQARRQRGQRGIHIICQKASAPTLDEASRIVGGTLQSRGTVHGP